jgi:methylated-DNA-[protein]-cysteine S-methyltransferase
MTSATAVTAKQIATVTESMSLSFERSDGLSASSRRDYYIVLEARQTRGARGAATLRSKRGSINDVTKIVAESSSEPVQLPIASAAWPVPAVASSLWLAWMPDGSLTHALWAADHEPRPSEIPEATPEGAVPTQVAQRLAAYFAGEPVDPAALAVAPSGTRFQLKVWNALRAVARGHVRSYVGIAIDVGQPRAMRAVGMANSRNPIAVVVPCHRVVEKDNRIGGYSSGLTIKRFLLELEGVHIVGDVVRPGQLTLI